MGTNRKSISLPWAGFVTADAPLKETHPGRSWVVIDGDEVLLGTESSTLALGFALGRDLPVGSIYRRTTIGAMAAGVLPHKLPTTQ